MYEVIIVEDDPMVSMINRQYVAQNPHFHVAASCADGASALDFISKHTVHLAILDMYMPRLDGIGLLRELRAKNLPVSVIMVTAANDSACLENALRLGIVDYLVKPFTAQRFQQALDSFLSRQNALRDLSSLSQQSIDSILGAQRDRGQDQLPKGIQDQTLETICSYMKNSRAIEMTSEEIADKVGLSRVTVRRYMNHLLEKGCISGRMNYETGGRPCMLYRWQE